MEPKFKLCDVVRLISGGPRMLVTAYPVDEDGTIPGQVVCMWFTEAGELRDNAFDEQFLVGVDESTRLPSASRKKRRGKKAR